MRLPDDTNEHGIPRGNFVCDSCGETFSVVPAPEPDSVDWENCLSENCESYDWKRDPEARGKVVSLDSQRPHCTFQDPVTKNVHVVPLDLVIDWKRGDHMPDEECVRALVEYWLIDQSVER